MEGSAKPEPRGFQPGKPVQPVAASRAMPLQFISFPRRFVLPPASAIAPRATALAGLDRALDVPLTVVHGPAGFGKTALLAEWLRRPACANAILLWYRAEPNDADFGRFATEWLNQLRLAMEEPESPTVTSVVPMLDVETAVAALHDVIASANKPVVTVIDDFSKADVSEFTHLLLQSLRIMPSNLHMVLAASTLPAALLENTGGLVDVPVMGPAELALSVEEIAERTGADLADAEALSGETAGWPAIIGLVADLRKANGAGELGDLLDDDIVHAYVTHRFVANLDEDVRQAMTSLATLDQFPADLAASAVGEAVIERLRETSRSIRPLFRSLEVPEPRFEVHPILQRSLRRLRLHLPVDARRAVDKAIVDWFVSRHLVAEALDYALQQGMTERLARLAEYFGPHTITLHAGVPLLRAIFDVIDAETVKRSPRLLAGRATILMKDGRFALAKAAMDEAASLLEAEGEGKSVFGSPSVDLICARYLMMLYNNDEFDETFISDEQAEVRQLSVEDGIVGFIHALRSIWFQRRSLFRRSETESGRSLYHYRKAGSEYGEASVLMVQSLAALAQGRLQKAEQGYGKAQQMINEYCPDDPGLNAVCAALLAEVKYERNEIDAAEELFLAAVDILEETDGWLEPYAAAYRVGVGVSLARGDYEGAEIVADRATQLAAQRGLVEVERLAQLHRVEIQLRQQNLAQADLELRRYDSYRAAPDRRRGSQDTAREQELAVLLGLRLLLGRGEAEAVLEQVAQLAATAESDGRYMQLARLNLLAVMAHWKQEDDRAALSVLRETVDVAAGKGYLRLFVDWGVELVPALRRLIDRGELSGAKSERVTRSVLRSISEEQVAAGVPQPFSVRELQVLSYLGRGHSNKQIARQLNVTESTIKFHLKKIFTRLGVTKRASAVIEARRLGLF